MSIGNSVGFIGRLTRDPELKTAGGDNRVCNFTLARNRISKNKDHPEVDFIDCVAWNQTADFLNKYFFKGNRVGVSGELRTRSYEDTNGVKRKVTEIFVNSLEFIDNKSNNINNNENDVVKKPNNDFEIIDDTEDNNLPF